MSTQSILHKMERWGYYLLPKAHPASPGYTGLLVAIRKTPTGQHFDPESIHLQLRDKNGLANRRILRLESRFVGSRHVCPGDVVLYDRLDKRERFFVFGASLDAVSTPGERVYSLHSPAPILDVTDRLESFPDQLAFEVEAMLAEFQASWGLDDEGFTRQLAHLDPFQFYLASLDAIMRRHKQNPALRNSHSGFYHQLKVEQEWLAYTEQWPATLPKLADLLENKQ